MPPEKLNAWGEPIEDEHPDDPHWVPPEERNEVDGPDSVSLGTTGDDLPFVNSERQAYYRALEDEATDEEE